MGDTGSGYESQIDVAKAMEIRCKIQNPDGILILGDVIYPAGVSSVDDKQWQSKLFSVYGGECLGSLSIYPVLGNHDYLGDVSAWFKMSERNPRWNFPNRHYSLVFPDIVTFYALDTNYPVRVRDTIPDFGQPQPGWTIAYGHHPIVSNSTAGGGHQGGGIRGWKLKKLLCNTVNSYLAGHAHHMEYRSIDDCKSDQYLAGGGGGVLYGINDDNDSEFVVSDHGFLELELSSETMTARFISKTGKILYEKIKNKN